MRRYPINGWLYDGLLEPALRNIKKKVTEFVLTHDLFPVVDICCGTGVQCYRISQNSSRIAGLDLDWETIHYAKSKFPSIPFICADAVRIPFKNSCFKGAILSYSIHEKSKENRSLLLQEVSRILTSEGKVIFVDFNKPWSRKSRLASLYVYGIERIAGKEHFSNGRAFLKQGGLNAFLERFGLTVVERHDVELAQTSIVLARFGIGIGDVP